MDERPLWIQLYWGKDQREGRFVLQNAKLPKVCLTKNEKKNKQNYFSLIIDFKTHWWKF